MKARHAPAAREYLGLHEPELPEIVHSEPHGRSAERKEPGELGLLSEIEEEVGSERPANGGGGAPMPEYFPDEPEARFVELRDQAAPYVAEVSTGTRRARMIAISSATATSSEIEGTSERPVRSGHPKKGGSSPKSGEVPVE
jgi:hypothetical protein